MLSPKRMYFLFPRRPAGRLDSLTGTLGLITQEVTQAYCVQGESWVWGAGAAQVTSCVFCPRPWTGPTHTREGDPSAPIAIKAGGTPDALGLLGAWGDGRAGSLTVKHLFQCKLHFP
jgi:hypothetical protein